MFGRIAFATQVAGLAVVIFGIFRIWQAPAAAARRAALPASQASGNAARYARGLTDFYRISGGIAVLAGIILLLVPFFAG